LIAKETEKKPGWGQKNTENRKPEMRTFRERINGEESKGGSSDKAIGESKINRSSSCV
jgi:hypothetical protein